MPHPERVLLVRLSHLGDVVHAVPVLHGLRRAWPEAELGWAIQGEFAGLLQGLEGLGRTFLFDRRGGPGAWLSLRRALRGWRPEVAVDAQGNLKSAAVTRLSGARRRIGLAPQDWQEPFGARFLTERAPPAYGLHAMHKMRALMERFAPDAPLSFDLSPTDAERAAGRAALAERLPEPASEGRRWLLHLGAGGDPRTWPAERCAALARALAERGDALLVLSGPAEAGPGAQVEQALRDVPRVAHWVGQRGLRELAALFSAAAAADARLVAGDSGPAHLAAACGLGVDFLSGPQDPERTGPWPLADEPGSPHRVLRAAPEALAPMEALGLEAVLEALSADPPRARV